MTSQNVTDGGDITYSQNSGGGTNQPGVDNFDFQRIMDNYYNYEPSGDDDTAIAGRRAFEQNMIQSAFDSQLSCTEG